MSGNYNLVFVGNQSIDKKVCLDGRSVEVIGGSAYNSFCSSKLFYEQLISAYFAPVGNRTSRAAMNQYNLNKEYRDDVIFEINELSGECNTRLAVCMNNTHWECDHLHISLRRDVDIESFLNGSVDFKSLSVDVTHASVEKYKSAIEALRNRIDFLFCNTQEYLHIKHIIIKGSFVVTNEDKPVRIQNAKSTKYFAVPTPVRSTKSVTGAGDSFIGAFLSELMCNYNITESVAAGIAAAQANLNAYGNEELDKAYFKTLLNSYKKYNLIMPNRIFVVGPSCSGKTTIINNNPNIFDPYVRFDDLRVLKERVNYDNGEFSTKQLMTFHDHDEVLPRATIKHDDATFKIIDDELWNDVIKRISKKLTSYSIIEFSRGLMKQYIDAFELALSLKKDETNLIIFIDAEYNTRLKRNFKRKNDGEHFVELETFETVYRKSLAEFFESNLSINGKTIPVIKIDNEDYSSNMSIERIFLTRATMT